MLSSKNICVVIGFALLGLAVPIHGYKVVQMTRENCRPSCTVVTKEESHLPFMYSYASFEDEGAWFLDIELASNRFSKIPVEQSLVEEGSIPLLRFYLFEELEFDLYGIPSSLEAKRGFGPIHYFMRLWWGFQYLGKFSLIVYDESSDHFIFAEDNGDGLSLSRYVFRQARFVFVDTLER